ncbi:acetyl-CoA C-acyltransferase [Cellulomonas carbonis]|uniref:Probable acetyl-CoA acetyltransferase n=1 Tax=Cellulomonas carbonis T26 TaxID=947969 RepID=A0A0A0BNZ9_9CELL|nr:acetyl-CoA C-acyltransferase [Cellulomonas carbonis]KGM08784.1 acetyl-CoA acetyltransferase [Cellulomonas carbonis T26]GGC03431.1 acetyl-CoA acetyltransferase [Cellulomonas carbonis]
MSAATDGRPAAGTSSPDDVVVVGAARTPQGRLRGGLSTVPATRLGSVAIRGALEQAGVSADLVEVVVLGQVLQAGAGQNPARQAALGAGIPTSAHASAVNKVCLSGLTAVIDVARLLRSGEAEVAVAGGMESMSLAPHLLPGSRVGTAYGSIELLDHMAYDGLTDAQACESMGLCTDRTTAERYALTREQQDEVAALSHQRAAAAWEAGTFKELVVPVTVPGRKGDTVVDRDEGIRPETTVETLARLRPAFMDGGHITAGNSSPISDGASAVVLTTRARAEAEGWTVLAALRAPGQVAGPDASLHSQPSAAILRALERQGWAVGDLDVIEINEAFGAVVAQSAIDLGVPVDALNVDGGGIALGHPIGASGARLVVHAAHALHRAGGGRAAVGLCGGGGQGEALLLEL